ncbi:hypothetical protein ACHAW6_003436 [Cyclotella cf. meneghiniana]
MVSITSSRNDHIDLTQFKTNRRLGLAVLLIGCIVLFVDEIVVMSKRGNNHIYKRNSDAKLDTANCSELLEKHRAGQISQTNHASPSYPIDKSYLARSHTQFPFHVSVHPEGIDGIRFDIFRAGVYYENIMTSVIGEILNEASARKQHRPVMIDVGANIGWFSLLAASHGAEVFSFEPNVINMIRFCESQLLNGWSLAQNSERDNRIHSYMKGVGSQHGQSLSMYAPDPKNPGANTFNQDLAKDHAAKMSGGELHQLDGGELPIVTLDALAKDQGWLSFKGKGTEIALMKIDIEGMEHVALQGAKQLLCKNVIQNILMEFNGESHRSDWVLQITPLLDCGYELYKIGGHKGPDQDMILTSKNPEVAIDEIQKKFGGGINVNGWFKVRTKRAG